MQSVTANLSAVFGKGVLCLCAGQPEGLLLVRLAGVELTPEGTAWLQRELKPLQVIWFQLLGREHLALECLVLVNKVNAVVRMT